MKLFKNMLIVATKQRRTDSITFSGNHVVGVKESKVPNVLYEVYVLPEGSMNGRIGAKKAGLYGMSSEMVWLDVDMVHPFFLQIADKITFSISGGTLTWVVRNIYYDGDDLKVMNTAKGSILLSYIEQSLISID